MRRLLLVVALGTLAACFDWGLPPVESDADADGDGDGDGDGDTDSDADADGDGDADGDDDADGDGDADGDDDADGDADGDADADDDLPDCVHPVCDVSPQCGCPTGEACYLLNGGGVQCSEVGTGTHGEGCVSFDDCEPETLCAGFMDDPQTCRNICITDTDCPADTFDSRCMFDLFNIDGIGVCNTGCDPRSSTPVCASDMACHFIQGEWIIATECTGELGDGRQGELCSSTNPSRGCAPGLLCHESDTRRECVTVCRLPDNADCPGATRCTSFSDGPAVIIDDIEYGTCQYPPE